MKKLGGMGHRFNHVTKMEFKSVIATSEAGVTDLLAQYVEDTFQPIQVPDFDFEHFNCIEQEWHTFPTGTQRINTNPHPG